MVNCPFCGATLNEEISFCPNCGRTVDKNLTENSKAEKQDQVPTRNSESFEKTPSVHNYDAGGIDEELNVLEKDVNQITSNEKTEYKATKIYHNSGRLYKDDFTTFSDDSSNDVQYTGFPLMSIIAFIVGTIIMFIITDFAVFYVGKLLYESSAYQSGNFLAINTGMLIFFSGDHYVLWSIILVGSIIQAVIFQFIFGRRTLSKAKLSILLYRIFYLILPTLNFIMLLLFYYGNLNTVDTYLVKVMLICGIILGLFFHFIYRATGSVPVIYRTTVPTHVEWIQ